MTRVTWGDKVFLTVSILLLVSMLLAQSNPLPCCQWKCYPKSGQSSCQQQGGIGMCRYYYGDECVHAPPGHPEIIPPGGHQDFYIGQCVVCCDSNGDGVPDTPIDDPATPFYDWKMNLWKHEREYSCGLFCYGEFTTNKGDKDDAEPIPAPAPVCPSGLE